MTLGMALIIFCLITGIIGGLAYAFITRVLGIESFSIYRKDLYDSKESDDEFYNRFDK